MTPASRPPSWQRLAAGLALPLLAILSLAAGPGTVAAQCPDPPPAPYVFLLMDTSGSLNWSTLCSSTNFGLGDCTPLCTTGDCFVPLQGDDPSSKLFLLKEGLQTALAAESGIQFGFGSFNQDELGVRAKHWIYEAAGAGVSLPGGTSYPASGAQEVFGLLWGCDTGSNDNELGCIPSKPADLPDAWELARVRRLPKGGRLFNQNVDFYIRHSSLVYRVRYTPTGGGTLGGSTVQTTVRVDRCNNAACTSTTLIGQPTVTWNLVTEFLSWDNSASSNPDRNNPQLSYFSQSAAADASTANTCSGWDPNTDSTADLYASTYDLRWPTDSSDLRGAPFTVGDVIPLDWLDDHNLDIQARLAPNLATSPMATPDYRISPYMNDLPSGAETFLRLKDEDERPLIASGSTPLGNSLSSFRTWYGGWSTEASANDPDWLCREKAVVLITDGDETCNADPCSVADDLWTIDGVQVYVVALGNQSSPGSQIPCIAANGGTSTPWLPETKQELIDALGDIFADVKAP